MHSLADRVEDGERPEGHGHKHRHSGTSRWSRDDDDEDYNIEEDVEEPEPEDDGDEDYFHERRSPKRHQSFRDTAFAARLRNTIDAPHLSDCVRWLSDGKTIAILESVFVRKALGGACFRTRKMSSFVRNLNKHGFHKIVISHVSPDNSASQSDPLWIHFRHPEFVREEAGIRRGHSPEMDGTGRLLTAGDDFSEPSTQDRRQPQADFELAGPGPARRRHSQTNGNDARGETSRRRMESNETGKEIEDDDEAVSKLLARVSTARLYQEFISRGVAPPCPTPATSTAGQTKPPFSQAEVPSISNALAITAVAVTAPVTVGFQPLYQQSKSSSPGSRTQSQAPIPQLIGQRHQQQERQPQPAFSSSQQHLRSSAGQQQQLQQQLQQQQQQLQQQQLQHQLQQQLQQQLQLQHQQHQQHQQLQQFPTSALQPFSTPTPITGSPTASMLVGQSFVPSQWQQPVVWQSMLGHNGLTTQQQQQQYAMMMQGHGWQGSSALLDIGQHGLVSAGQNAIKSEARQGFQSTL